MYGVVVGARGGGLEAALDGEEGGPDLVGLGGGKGREYGSGLYAGCARSGGWPGQLGRFGGDSGLLCDVVPLIAVDTGRSGPRRGHRQGDESSSSAVAQDAMEHGRTTLASLSHCARPGGRAGAPVPVLPVVRGESQPGVLVLLVKSGSGSRARCGWFVTESDPQMSRARHARWPGRPARASLTRVLGGRDTRRR